ncbi:uncharacterized protein LOC144152129 [Haemaphysalis longicornis]
MKMAAWLGIMVFMVISTIVIAANIKHFEETPPSSVNGRSAERPRGLEDIFKYFSTKKPNACQSLEEQLERLREEDQHLSAELDATEESVQRCYRNERPERDFLRK